MTKPGSMPKDLLLPFEYAEERRSLHDMGHSLDLNEVTALEYTAYDAALRAIRTIENEAVKESQSKDKKPEGQGVGDGTAIKW